MEVPYMSCCGNCKYWYILKDSDRNGNNEFGVCGKMVDGKDDSGEIIDTIYWRGNDGTEPACEDYEDNEGW